MLLAFGLLAYAVREYNKYNKNKIAQLAEINTNKDRVRFVYLSMKGLSIMDMKMLYLDVS